MGRDQKARQAGPDVAATRPQLTDAQAAQIHEDTTRLNVRDRVAYWDKRQGSDDKFLCPNDAAHGALTIHGSGTVLLCGAHKGGAHCTGTMPVSL